MTWTLFVLDFDETYNNNPKDDDGVQPVVYLVPQNKLEEVRNLAHQSKNDFWSDDESDLCMIEYFEKYLDTNNIDFKVVGDINLTFGERKGSYLDNNIPIEYI